MAITRLDSDERRQAIVDAAVPLFARNGFGGTTTRELAEAAGISEALLFRHFPSKQLLYREILQQLGCQGDPALEQLASLPASAATLVCMVRFMVRRFIAGSDSDRADLDPRLRLVLHSCLKTATMRANCSMRCLPGSCRFLPLRSMPQWRRAMSYRRPVGGGPRTSSGSATISRR
jgi:AcrR family transcriptional regulator